MNKPIKIAIVAPSFGETGGPEVVAKNLAHSLQKFGIEVALFAPGDWKVDVKHIHTMPKSLWNMDNFNELSDASRINLRVASQLEVIKYQEQFDIVHLHSQKYAYIVAKFLKKPCVLTFHSKITESEFNLIKEVGVHAVSLSETHANGCEVSAIIPNSFPAESIKASFKKGEYLMVLGRIHETKGFDVAINVARMSGKKLLIFGRIGSMQSRIEYFNKKIKPFLNENIKYMGEASREDVFKYLAGAEALLVPIQSNIKVCPLVVAESLMCGTPVIGTPMNPVPELLKDSQVACLSNNLADLVKAAKNTSAFNRRKCRQVAEKQFGSDKMTIKYIELYKKILSR